jgi:ribokinase
VRIAVIGHVEHITIARVLALPAPGEIVHLDEPAVIAGGGGGIAFHQLAKSDAELHLFTAIGIDDASLHVYHEISETRATIHAALRMEPHTRDLVVVTPDGERTIFVVGRPLHPAIDDRLSWEILDGCDAVYFTGEDPATLRRARNARLLVVTARRKHAIEAAGIRPDVVIGSARDPRERGRLADYAKPPGALIMTEGRDGGTIETADGVTRFEPPERVEHPAGMYGAGDTFAGALTYFLAHGDTIEHACMIASRHAAAVLSGINPIECQLPLT